MNTRRLFVASCLALLTTSMVFSIRGDIVDALTLDFHITKEQMGAILSPAFWGFTLSIIIGGSLVDWLGMRNLLLTSSLGYVGAVLVLALLRTCSTPAVSAGAIFAVFRYVLMLLMGYFVPLPPRLESAVAQETPS